MKPPSSIAGMNPDGTWFQAAKPSTTNPNPSNPANSRGPPDAARHPAQRNTVQSSAHRKQDKQGAGGTAGQIWLGMKHKRTGTGKKENQDSRQHRPDQDRVAHRIGRARDQFGLIVKRRDRH